MGRIRTIKPEFFKHEALFDLEQQTGLPIRLAFAGLWTCCDREGRFKWRPRQLKSEIFPYDEIDFSRVLDALVTRGHLVRYAIGTDEYGCIPSWHKHQYINNKESASCIPSPSREARVDDAIPDMLCSSRVEGERKGKGKEGERNGIDREVHEIASLYPKIHDAFNLTHEVAIAIAEAIGRDGRDLVWAGTKCAGEAMALWAPEMKQFIPSPPRFFRESQYRKDPAEWERRDSGKSKNVASDRVAQQLEAVAIAKRSLGLAH